MIEGKRLSVLGEVRDLEVARWLPVFVRGKGLLFLARVGVVLGVEYSVVPTLEIRS